MKKIEYSLIVKQKLLTLRKELKQRFGPEISKRVLKQITDSVRSLSAFEKQGQSVSAMYNIESDYRYLYVCHNYLFYRIEMDQIIIVEMFNEKEDFIWKLFGIKTTQQETNEYWDEEE